MALFSEKKNTPPGKSFRSRWSRQISTLNLTATLKRINWIGDCYLMNMDMVERNDLRSIKTLAAIFNNSVLQEHNVTVELKLQGRNLAARRDIQDHIFYHTGDVMKLYKSFQTFRVKIKKRVLIEGEPGTTCRNYPNSDFESYRECDDKYMKNRVDMIAPGLMPVWMTEDLSKVTTKPVVSSSDKLGKSDSGT